MPVRSGQLAFARSQRWHKFKDGTCPHCMINLVSNPFEVDVLDNFSDYCTSAQISTKTVCSEEK